MGNAGGRDIWDVPVFFLGKTALIANKTAAGRPKDLADVDALIKKEPS